MPITPPAVWLERIVAAEEAALAGGVDRRSFMLIPRGSMRREMEHPGWDPEWDTPTEHDIDDLRAEGWIRFDGPSHGNTRTFSLTAEGRRRGQRGQRAHADAQRVRVSMDWTLLEPVLDAAIVSYEEAGAPDGGIYAPRIPLPDGATPAMLAELTRAGLLIECEAGADQVEGPGFVRPSLEALQLKRGWPRDAADAAIERLVTFMLEQAEASDDPEQQTRLRAVAAWLGRVGTDIVTGAGATIAAGQLPHL
jgi:hypothetical protein